MAKDAAAMAKPRSTAVRVRPLRNRLDKGLNAITSQQSAGKITGACAANLRNLLTFATSAVSCRVSG